MLQENSSASVDYMLMNLSSLATVAEFSERYKKKYSTLDLLINNAGKDNNNSKSEVGILI